MRDVHFINLLHRIWSAINRVIDARADVTEPGKERGRSNPPSRAKILATALPTFKVVVPHHSCLHIFIKMH